MGHFYANNSDWVISIFGLFIIGALLIHNTVGKKMKNLFSHTALCPQMIPIWTRKVHYCSFRKIYQTKTIQNYQNYAVGLNQEFLLFSPILWSVTIVLSFSCFSFWSFSPVYFYLHFRPPESPETTSKSCFPT